MLPADLRVDGFKNTAYNLGADLGHVDFYARLAGIVVDRLDVSELLDGREVTEDWMLGFVQFPSRYRDSSRLGNRSERKH